MIGNELKVYDGLTSRQQLNLFRNLYYNDGNATEYGIIANAINDCFTAYIASKSEWISVEERLPTEDEYLTHHNDGLDTLKRITVAYMTDTVEYTIGCYDGYKWMNQLGNKIIRDVVAWKPFELYEAPKMTRKEDEKNGETIM